MNQQLYIQVGEVRFKPNTQRYYGYIYPLVLRKYNVNNKMIYDYRVVIPGFWGPKYLKVATNKKIRYNQVIGIQSNNILGTIYTGIATVRQH